MDTINTDEAKTHIPATTPTIILDSSQYFHYHTHQLEILSPDLRHLAFIGKAMRIENTETDALRLRDQVALVSCLLSNINDSFNFSIPAGLGLADLLGRVEDVYYHK